MANKKVTKKKQSRKDYHHLGSPEFGYLCEYNKDNMEYIIGFTANGSNTHFLGEQVQQGDELYLGLSESDFEVLLEHMIGAACDRLKNKLERLNHYQKLYYKEELNGTDEEWENNEGWNRLSNPYS